MQSSRNIVVESPLSLVGSAKRLFNLTDNVAIRLFVVLPLLAIVWPAILVYYLVFGWFLVPYRLMRRSQRSRKLADMRHRETLETLQAMAQQNQKAA